MKIEASHYRSRAKRRSSFIRVYASLEAYAEPLRLAVGPVPGDVFARKRSANVASAARYWAFNRCHWTTEFLYSGCLDRWKKL